MDILKLTNNADNYRNSGQTDKAIKLYRELFYFHKKQKDYYGAAAMLHMIGVTYKIDNKTKDSLNYLTTAKIYYADHNFQKELGGTLRDIGIAYEYKDKFIEAEKYLKTSVDILEKTTDWASYGISLSKLGLIYAKQKKLAEAQKSLSEGLKVLQKTNHWFFQATALMHIGEFYLITKDYPLAISSLGESIKIFDQNNQQNIHTRRYAQIWGMMANAYANLKDFNSAKNYYQQCLSILSKNYSRGAKVVILKDIRAGETKKLIEKLS